VRVVFLPYQTLMIETPMSPVEAMERLAAQVGPRPGLLGGFWGADYKPYTGTVRAAEFKLTRNLMYRNSFRPVIIGRAEATAHGALVRVSLRPDFAVLLFMLLWVGLLVEFELAELWAYWEAWQAGEPRPWPPIRLEVPGLMLLAGYGLAWVGFRLEAALAERFLRRLFAHSQWTARPRTRAWPRIVALAVILGVVWVAIVWGLPRF
jgi:hypothetical protein